MERYHLMKQPGRPALNRLGERQQHFDGATYQPRLDYERLSNQLERVKAATLDTGWWTVTALTLKVGGSETSVSARLRDLRKQKFGGYHVESRRVKGGVWHYRVSHPLDETMKGDV